MPDELESRLERAFAGLGTSSGDVEDSGLATALRVLPHETPLSAHRQLLLLLAASVGIVLLITAGSLAAAGRLQIGQSSRRGPARSITSASIGPSQLRLPSGASGIAAVIDGRLWLTMRDGTRIERLPVTTATLSPHALYVAAGIGHSLVAMAPNGRRAWIHPVAGDVTGIAWAPSGLRIAYVVRTDGHTELRMIEANGLRDRLIDAAAGQAPPSWRADSLALAYVGAGGHAVVYDLAHASRRLVETGLCSGRIDKVLFAPSGPLLAAASKSSVYLYPGLDRSARCVGLMGTVIGIAWAGKNIVAAETPPTPAPDEIAGVVTLAIEPGWTLSSSWGGVAAAPVGALAAADASRVAAVLTTAGDTRLVLADPPPFWIGYGTRKLQVRESLLTLPGRARVSVISIH